MRFEKSVEIGAGVVDVFEVMVDVERWPEWTASVTAVKPLDPGPLAVGSRVAVTQPRLGTMTWTVTEITPASGFTWEVRKPAAHSIASHRLEALGEGRTRLTLVLEQRGVLGELFGRLFRKLTVRYLDLEANGLRRRCEEG
jgi:hypothetical protein